MKQEWKECGAYRSCGAGSCCTASSAGCVPCCLCPLRCCCNLGCCSCGWSSCGSLRVRKASEVARFVLRVLLERDTSTMVKDSSPSSVSAARNERREKRAHPRFWANDACVRSTIIPRFSSLLKKEYGSPLKESRGVEGPHPFSLTANAGSS